VGEERIKESDGMSEFNYEILLRPFVNVTLYPQYNNNMVIRKLLKNNKKGKLECQKNQLY
jgi:hypothetical protein